MESKCKVSDIELNKIWNEMLKDPKHNDEWYIFKEEFSDDKKYLITTIKFKNYEGELKLQILYDRIV